MSTKWLVYHQHGLHAIGIQTDQPHLPSVTEEASDVQFYWSIISADSVEEVATTLLRMIVDTWVKIGDHSTARALLEQYKLSKKKSVQKSILISSTSSSSK